jgi:phosphoadenosine phosphosulfate reductase
VEAMMENGATGAVPSFGGSPAEEIVAWAAQRFGDRLALACSFGAEDMVLLDMLSKVAPRTRVFVLDTGRLHQATYDLMERARERYGIQFVVHFPRTETVEQLVRVKGPNSFYESLENRKECCHIRKVEPLSRALAGLDAWFTGLRRGQSVTREDLEVAEIDGAHGGIWKINPLADWSEEQVWDYIRANNVPYHKLHDQGYPSIGCEPCTRAVLPGQDRRSGRWWWEDPAQKECGLHVRQQ